jgi:hypothetical protein
MKFNFTWCCRAVQDQAFRAEGMSCLSISIHLQVNSTPVGDDWSADVLWWLHERQGPAWRSRMTPVTVMITDP